MVTGIWYPQGSANPSSAQLYIAENSTHYIIEVHHHIRYQGDLTALNISARLGNVERKITLEDGSIFATKDNDAIDRIAKISKQGHQLLHRLESNMGWVIIALIITMLTVFATFKWGIPWTSEKIAYSLPHKANQLIANGTLTLLDDYLFEESALSPEQQTKIRQHFKDKLIPLSHSDNAIEYKLHFRLWLNDDISIPNAFALPSGDIIVTDKFIELAENQAEIDAILLHEMGHVEYRHSLRTLIESTFISVIIITVLGDSSGVADMGVGVSSLLVTSSYSRDNESEADEYAFQKMLIAKIDPNAFANIMNRMTLYMTTPDDIQQKDSKPVEDPENSLMDYISSHPRTESRVKIAAQYSLCFKQGLSHCEMEVRVKEE